VKGFAVNDRFDETDELLIKFTSLQGFPNSGVGQLLVFE
jgi:hypothetical protein